MKSIDAKNKLLEEFPAASELASSYGMKLLKRGNNIHYQLIGEGWMIDLWPTTGKARANPDRKLQPDVSRLPKGWTLEVAVQHFSALMD